MLYETPKTKRYIIIGAVAIVLAVLVVAVVPLFRGVKKDSNSNLSVQHPLTAKEKKIQQDAKEFSQKMKVQLQPEQAIAEQKIKEDVAKISEEVKNAPKPSKEEIQKALEQLNK